MKVYSSNFAASKTTLGHVRLLEKNINQVKSIKRKLMKKFTVLAVLAAMVAPALGNDQMPVMNGQLVEKAKKVTDKLRKAGAAGERTQSRMADLGRMMKPGTMKTYGWHRNNWVAEDTYTYSYDPQGNVLVESIKDAEGHYARTMYEYNGNGMITLKETMTSADGVNFVNKRKTELEYDLILPDVITSQSEWMWKAGKDGGYGWQPSGDNYKRVINRDEAGNVTSVVMAELSQGEYSPTKRLTVTYGEDGQATGMVEEVLDYYDKEYYWEEGMKVTDIVWDRTDGQLVDIDEIFGGANRVKTCRMHDLDGVVMDVEVEYADGSDAYVGTITLDLDGMAVHGTISYTPLDNGGAMVSEEISYLGTSVYSSTEELHYEDWDLMTYYCISMSAYGVVIRMGQRGEVEYDADGKPEVYTISEFDTDQETLEEVSDYILRAEYSDYVDVTAGVDNPNASPATEGRCYDLQGRPVSDTDSHGIVIKEGKTVMIR